MPTDQTNQTDQTDLNLDVKFIIVTVMPGEVPACDLGGVDPWAASNILQALANHIWESLPDPEVTERTP